MGGGVEGRDPTPAPGRGPISRTMFSAVIGSALALAPATWLSSHAQRYTQHRAALAAVRCATDDELQVFHDWLNEQGVDTTAVQGKMLAGFGLGLAAGPQGIKAGETLLAIPSSLHITPSATAASPLGQAVSEVVQSDDMASLLALGLLQELGKGDASLAAPYMKILPSMQGMGGVPLLWEDTDLETLLDGSHLRGMVASERANLLAQWQAIETLVMPQHDPSLFPRDVFNAPGYLWAHAIVLTRALPFGDELSLIPFLGVLRSPAPLTIAELTCIWSFGCPPQAATWHSS